MGLKEGMDGPLKTGIGALQQLKYTCVVYGCFHTAVGELSHGDKHCIWLAMPEMLKYYIWPFTEKVYRPSPWDNTLAS